MGVESEVRVWGEEVVAGDKGWRGGVPTLVGKGAGWVGRLNGLLKFNHPFGEEGVGDEREFEPAALPSPRIYSSDREINH